MHDKEMQAGLAKLLCQCPWSQLEFEWVESIGKIEQMIEGAFPLKLMTKDDVIPKVVTWYQELDGSNCERLQGLGRKASWQFKEYLRDIAVEAIDLSIVSRAKVDLPPVIDLVDTE